MSGGVTVLAAGAALIDAVGAGSAVSSGLGVRVLLAWGGAALRDGARICWRRLSPTSTSTTAATATTPAPTMTAALRLGGDGGGGGYAEGAGSAVRGMTGMVCVIAIAPHRTAFVDDEASSTNFA